MNDPVPDFIIVPVENLDFHLRIVFLKKADHIRHPHGCYACKTSDSKFPLHFIVNVESRLAKLIFLIHHFLNIRKQTFSIVCQDYTFFYPGK